MAVNGGVKMRTANRKNSDAHLLYTPSTRDKSMLEYMPPKNRAMKMYWMSSDMNMPGSRIHCLAARVVRTETWVQKDVGYFCDRDGCDGDDGDDDEVVVVVIAVGEVGVEDEVKEEDDPPPEDKFDVMSFAAIKSLPPPLVWLPRGENEKVRDVDDGDRGRAEGPVDDANEVVDDVDEDDDFMLPRYLCASDMVSVNWVVNHLSCAATRISALFFVSTTRMK